MAKKGNPFTTVTTLSKIIAVILFVMLPVIAFYMGVAYQERIDKPLLQELHKTPTNKPSQIQGGVACTMDARLCPDGSAVGREGPNCEFKKCPGEK